MTFHDEIWDNNIPQEEKNIDFPLFLYFISFSSNLQVASLQKNQTLFYVYVISLFNSEIEKYYL